MSPRRVTGSFTGGAILAGFVAAALVACPVRGVSPARVAGPAPAPQPTAAQLLSSASRTFSGSGLALTPPMGWNGYNHFGKKVTASIVEADARAMVASGMQAAGYTYVNLDGGWDLLNRSGNGNLQPNPRLFPRGMRPVADYVHSLGLKFGIYASAGSRNCAGTSDGSYGHYLQDARTFASWGVDYVKLDWCHIPFGDYPTMSHRQVSQTLATQMRTALTATGRAIIYDVNDTNWRIDKTPTWGAQAANLWRTTGDIRDSYASMVQHFTRNVGNYAHAGPGAWNDPDMLEVGNGGMSTIECQTQFSLWAEMAAPLIAGNDLPTMSAATRSILTNASVIAIDQDPLGRQGYPVASGGGHWVLTKPLANGDRAVVLFNQGDTPATISTTAARVGLGGAAAYTLRNLWTGSLTRTAGDIAARVPAHGVVMYRVAKGVPL